MLERSSLPCLLLLLAACHAPEPNAPPPVAQTQSGTKPAAPILPPPRADTAQAPPKPDADTRAQRFEALKSEFEKEQQAYYELIGKAKTNEEVEEIAKTAKRPDTAAYGTRLQSIFDEDPSDATAFDILQWALTQDRALLERTKLCAALEKYHFERAELETLLARLDFSRDECLAKFVTRISEASPHAAVRGTALFRLASAKKDEAEEIRHVQGLSNDKDKKDAAEWMGEERMRRLASSDLASAENAAIALYERVSKEYRDVPQMAGTPYETTLGKRADGELFELKNLVPGKPAPEIEGEDLTGVAFKLSDYRGKVVMLDFWGFW